MYTSTFRGFSFPELTITLAIMAIFAHTAIPATASFIDQQRANAYIRQFSQNLAYARVAATSSNLPVQVCPFVAGQCAEQWQTTPVQVSLLYPDSRTVLRELPAIHNQHKLIFNRAGVTFRRDGSLDGFENGTFLYCGRQGASWHFRLTLNQAGRNRLTKVATPCPG